MNNLQEQFQQARARLNDQQRRAVDTLEGPVMVIAGPGTGKTQVLALRIANILQQTDVGASALLCLTFTRSGVTAMRKRLVHYIGTDANKVVVSTFHGFAQRLVEKHYDLLGFAQSPELLDESKSVFLADEILQGRAWEYLRPRANPASYFGDIKNLISLLKRESVSAESFKLTITSEIENLTNDPASISSRGETKGQLKKEIQTKIESLHKTAEVVDFYHEYEKVKRERCLMDYDDVLTYAVQLVTDYEDVCAEIRENHQYILVDEHQDSSGIQNAFLTTVWAEVERPNIFVVGDDRQLIYGFGGASMNHFTNFVNTFRDTQLITLIENYRSTSPILDLADTLLSSELAQGKLSSNHAENLHAEPVTLAEYDYARDEVIAAGLYFKKYIEQGISPRECALLVPKNYQVKSAVQILSSLGVPVSGSSSESLFAMREYADLRRVFQIVIDPYNATVLAESLFDSLSQVPPLLAHTFLKSLKPKNLTLQQFISYGDDQGLFAGDNPIAQWGKQLQSFIEIPSHEPVVKVISDIGNTLLVNTATDHQTLVRNVEVVRTLIHLALSRQQQHPHETLKAFVEYLDRLEEYGTSLPVALIGSDTGVQVMTLHGSKGLEFDHVWIAHMNQSALMNQRRGGFTLPHVLAEKVEKKDEMTARREVYVAITRAKTFCTLSFAKHDIKGADLELAHILAELPDIHFVKKTAEQTTGELIAHGEAIYTKDEPVEIVGTDIEQLQQLVTARFAESNVSVTLLNNFFECPWKWYFRNFLQLPDVKGASLIFGSAMHRVLEIIIRESKAPTKKQIEELVRNALISEGIEDHHLEQEMLKGITCIQQFIDRDFKNLASDRMTERSISYRDPQFPNLSMYGKIDLTEKFPDGTMIVTDFKTGSSKTTGMIEKMTDDGRMSDYLRQLSMYSYLIAGSDNKQGMGDASAVAQSKLYFLEADEKDKNRIYSTHITGEHIELLKKDIADYQSAIESGNWISQECHFKPYGTGATECEYCKRAREVYVKQ
jgi:DNA helicase-2/ATP-dependent DNA helicase PcrA